MFHLKTKLGIICCCITLFASCQSVQKPDITIKPTTKTTVKEEPKTDNVLAILKIAIEDVNNNDLDSAQEILEVYLAEYDDNRAKINLALIYMKKGEPQLAKELFTSVQELDANNAIALEHLAIIARQEGQFQHAKSLYLKALKSSDKPSIHLNYAILLDLYLNKLTAALKHYEIYQRADLAQQDNIELDKWIADLTIRIKRENK